MSLRVQKYKVFSFVDPEPKVEVKKERKCLGHGCEEMVYGESSARFCAGCRNLVAKRLDLMEYSIGKSGGGE